MMNENQHKITSLNLKPSNHIWTKSYDFAHLFFKLDIKKNKIYVNFLLRRMIPKIFKEKKILT